jgi:hypothetical protein
MTHGHVEEPVPQRTDVVRLQWIEERPASPFLLIGAKR